MPLVRWLPVKACIDACYKSLAQVFSLAFALPRSLAPSEGRYSCSMSQQLRVSTSLTVGLYLYWARTVTAVVASLR